MIALAFVLLMASIHFSLDAASFSGTQTDQYGKLEPGFVRKADRSIALIAYCRDDPDTVSKLIDGEIDAAAFAAKSLEAITQATLFRECQIIDEHGPTCGLHLDGSSTDYVIDAVKQRFGSKAMHVCERGGLSIYEQSKHNKLHGEGEFIQTIPRTWGNDYVLRLAEPEPSYERQGRERVRLVKVQPFSPEDCARMSGGMDWLATVEGGCRINLYWFTHWEPWVWNEVFDTNPPDLIDATPHEFTRDEKYPVRAALRLFTKAEDDLEPLICSFAFSSTQSDRKLALIFPRQVMLWELYATDYGDDYADDFPPHIKAKGKVIAQADLSPEKSFDELYCFNTAVFSRAEDTLEKPFLYIAGNKFITRYACEDGSLEQFPYTEVPGLSGSRSIAISRNGERLAVADPRAGVAVFETKTMALLCTLLQGSVCRHIAIDGDLLATSVLNEEGKSRESLWKIDRKKPNVEGRLS